MELLAPQLQHWWRRSELEREAAELRRALEEQATVDREELDYLRSENLMLTRKCSDLQEFAAGAPRNSVVGRGRAAKTQHVLRTEGGRTVCTQCWRSCATRWRAKLGSTCNMARAGPPPEGGGGRPGGCSGFGGLAAGWRARGGRLRRGCGWP